VNDPELARLRQDMEVMQEAAGLGLPFGWRDVWLTLGLVPCGLLILVWGLMGWDHVIVSTVPALLLALIYVGFQVAQYRREGGSRYLKQEWIASAVTVLAFAGLIAWEKWLGLPSRPVRGAAIIFCGAMLLVLAFSSRQRRVYVAAPIVLIPFGIAVPLCSTEQIPIVGGVTVIAAGLVAAAILALQLRADGSQRERATH
jgi:hypothetical protein